jgi:hypothetical protein
MKTYNRAAAVVMIFIIVNALVFFLKKYLESHGLDVGFLLTANLVLFLLSLAGFLFQMRGLQSSNTHAFVRSVYASLLLKLFVVMIALGIYLFTHDGKINMPALFASLLLYLVYTVMEVRQLMKTLRKKPDA